MNLPNTIGDAALDVLATADPMSKCVLSRQFAKAWQDGHLKFEFAKTIPLRPARPDKPELLSPKLMPRRRNIGQRDNMVSLLHAVAHIEFNAIDLAWDIVTRFGEAMPRDFTTDWIKVADDETRHFKMISDRLKFYNASYGDLPAHDGLWQSAMDTAHSLQCRLAIVPLVLEARGLDVTPPMINRFKKASDFDSAAALDVIYQEEISHVQTGQKWFEFLCQQDNSDPVETYHRLVRKHFKGHIKPPFNNVARSLAGMPEAFYLPLSVN